MAADLDYGAKSDDLANKDDDGNIVDTTVLLASEEWLASCILERVPNPRTVCILALINRNFSSASTSDLVWCRFLPPAAAHVLASLSHDGGDDSSTASCRTLSKRDLYFQLCKGITYDGGLRKFWVDRGTGGECLMISARALSIIWGSSPQYWKWGPLPGSCFPEVAHLKMVCWFDISGTAVCPQLRPGRYTISFRIQLSALESWSHSPIKLCVENKTYAHPPERSEVLFGDPNTLSEYIYQSPTPFAMERMMEDRAEDESELARLWIECDVGEFIVEDDNGGNPVEVHFSMRETEILQWKRGFVLDGAIIRPRYVVDNLARESIKASMLSRYTRHESLESPFFQVTTARRRNSWLGKWFSRG